MRRLAIVVATLTLLGSACGGEDAGGTAGVDGRLVGIWRWDAGAAGELILTPQGTFQQVITWNGLMTLDAGLYGTGDGFVHFAVQRHEPVYYGPEGTPMAYVTSFTYFYRFLDANRVVFSDRIVNTEWTAYRVQ